jgi:RecB family endonuclease NucS
MVVIELKVGQADDKVCGQILRHMGWVQRNLANGRQVRGTIIAHGFAERVRYAVEALPTIELQR